ncbi:hypothetical protein GQ42DRAFT_157563 [Ramicandelaber brevisporus]|nr:hypothetical protein GQ42DRAFT_157563 [Ramicandelaber brevisporus]
MRFAVIVAAAAFVATAVSAEDATPTVPQSVDQTKPDSVKSYYSSVLSDAKALEAQMTPFFPSDKVEQVKTLAEAGLKLAEARVATATASAELADIATKLAIADAQIKKAAADPKAAASSALANFDNGIKSASSALNAAATSSKGNAAMSDVSVSAARLAAGVIGGAAAFAVLF